MPFEGVYVRSEYEIQICNILETKKRKEIMIAVYIIIIPIFTVCMVRFLYKYSVHRAKYLVNMELGGLSANLAEDETRVEDAPVFQPAALFEMTTNRIGVSMHRSEGY